ncbi:hypothetical protein P0E66_15325 [Enterococcus faecalis]|uniref:hypothetical protein n=1 Tax=Enterococcus faecalis TaxID=1351 RepID=UPI0025B14BBC|nr:hypothetical protein [Enterococcus faecalis]MDN3202478.1 hypothetical protein [Enterococcus faecalis]
MSKVLKWLEIESERLEKECDTNDDQFKTVNHSFIQGFNYALANVEVIELEEPELNPNQQIVLDWLKESCKLHGLREVIEIMGFLSTTGGKMKYKQVAYAYGDLNDDELKQVLQAFSQWALEEENRHE